MKIIEQSDATGSLGDYAAEIDKGAVIITSQGQPVAALVPIENADLETAALSTNRQFLDLIERLKGESSNRGKYFERRNATPLGLSFIPIAE